ncbi:hypothetical protein BuS5_02487 [Desulfosarcina sp. BuS5]|nr:hypothetical protein BuS5_02487 [Desulfosarcina sp. BuS5]
MLLSKFSGYYIIGKSRQKNRVHARDLVCYWSAIELGISMADLAKRFGLTLSAVSYAVKRGEEIAKKAIIYWRIKLLDYLRTSLKLVPVLTF